MTNDKLPEEIQGQINNEAYGHVKGLSIEHSKAHQKAGYIAGATAWAPWKVKHDELQATIDDKIDKALHTERNKLQAKVTASEVAWAKECQSLKDQAQRMADALEWIKTYGPVDERTVKFIDKALQQFKDGKEVGEQVEAKEGIIRVILAGAYEVSKDAASAEEYLKSEGVDVAQLKANAQYFIWKADLIRITKEKTGESVVKINDEEAVKWYNDGFTPEQTFRETWQSDGD